MVTRSRGSTTATRPTRSRSTAPSTRRAPTNYGALVIPGGVGNPDTMRMDENAVALVRELFEQGEPVGVICHGRWMLVEAAVVRGRTVTSWPSLRTDIRNAGGNDEAGG
jgi:protease I